MERIKNLITFKNDLAEFTPSQWTTIDSVLRPVLFKVVNKDMRSLGLRKNPNSMFFRIHTWNESNTTPVAGNSDVGGIWCALKLSGATTLSKYMMAQYGIETRIFRTAVDTPLYANSYRVKVKSVYLIDEV